MSSSLVQITNRTSFSCAHLLYDHNKSHADNIKLYGKCANCHGHNYELHITLKGEIDKETGMVMNFYDIDQIVQEHVLDKIDHKYLNEDVEEFKNLIPTAENIIIIIWNWLKPHLKDLYHIKLFETENHYASYMG